MVVQASAQPNSGIGGLELIAKAIAGEPTVIEQNGKRAVLLPCEGLSPDHFYLHTGEEVQILAVLHGARDLSSIVAEWGGRSAPPKVRCTPGLVPGFCHATS